MAGYLLDRTHPGGQFPGLAALVQIPVQLIAEARGEVVSGLEDGLAIIGLAVFRPIVDRLENHLGKGVDVLGPGVVCLEHGPGAEVGRDMDAQVPPGAVPAVGHG